MTTSVITQPVGRWDEPDGVAARGTLVVLAGRGETTSSYARFGRRIAADAYKVRVVVADDLDDVRAAVGELVADDTLPSPTVLVGSDTGAAYAAALLDRTDGVDAAVVAGIALPDSATAGSWDDELEARTACPTHRRAISEDDGFARGGLAAPVDVPVPTPVTKPVLVVHGSADPITGSADAFEPFRDLPHAQLRLVVGGRHDVLNDVSHRSVAATVVLFLERLRLGATLPVVVGEVQ